MDHPRAAQEGGAGPQFGQARGFALLRRRVPLAVRGPDDHDGASTGRRPGESASVMRTSSSGWAQQKTSLRPRARQEPNAVERRFNRLKQLRAITTPTKPERTSPRSSSGSANPPEIG
ncbi:hypothetical protein GCM10010273_20220 [Streptomyces lavendulocolor]